MPSSESRQESTLAEESSGTPSGGHPVKRMSGPNGQTITLTASLIASQLMVAVAYLIGARATTPIELGVLLSAIAISSVAAGIIDFGLGSYLIREVASGRLTQNGMYARLWQRLLSAGTIALVVSLPAALWVHWSGVGWQSYGWIVLVFAATLLMQSAQVPLRAAGLMGRVALASFVDRAVFLVLVWWLVGLGLDGAVALPIGLAAGLLVDAGLSVVLNVRSAAAKIGSSERLNVGGPSHWFRAWRGSQGYGFAAVIGSAQQLDVAVIGFSGGAAASGAYGAVSRWTSPLLLPSTALTQVGMAHAPKAASTLEAVKNFRRVAWVLVLSVVVSISVSIFAEPIASTLLGPAYDDSAAIFTVLALSIVPTLFAQPLAMVLQSRGKERGIAWVLAVGLICRLALCLILGAQLGGLAAAVAVLSQQSLIFVILVFMIGQVMVRERDRSGRKE
jgi:O-antigen/teichoic acid export membrane protein